MRSVLSGGCSCTLFYRAGMLSGGCVVCLGPCFSVRVCFSGAGVFFFGRVCAPCVVLGPVRVPGACVFSGRVCALSQCNPSTPTPTPSLPTSRSLSKYFQFLLALTFGAGYFGRIALTTRFGSVKVRNILYDLYFLGIFFIGGLIDETIDCGYFIVYFDGYSEYGVRIGCGERSDADDSG